MMTALEYEQYILDIRLLTGDTEKEVRLWISNMASSMALEFPFWEVKKFIAIVGRYPTKDEINLIRGVNLDSFYHLL